MSAAASSASSAATSSSTCGIEKKDKRRKGTRRKLTDITGGVLGSLCPPSPLGKRVNKFGKEDRNGQYRYISWNNTPLSGGSNEPEYARSFGRSVPDDQYEDSSDEDAVEQVVSAVAEDGGVGDLPRDEHIDESFLSNISTDFPVPGDHASDFYHRVNDRLVAEHQEDSDDEDDEVPLPGDHADDYYHHSGDGSLAEYQYQEDSDDEEDATNVAAVDGDDTATNYWSGTDEEDDVGSRPATKRNFRLVIQEVCLSPLSLCPMFLFF